MGFLDDAGSLVPLLAVGGLLSGAGGGRRKRGSGTGLLTRLMEQSAQEQTWRREQEALRRQQEMNLYGDLTRLAVEQGYGIPEELTAGMSRHGIDIGPLQGMAQEAYHKAIGPEFERFAGAGLSAPEELLAAATWQDLNRVRQQQGDTAYRDAVMTKLALQHAADPAAVKAMGALPSGDRAAAPGKIHGDPGGFLSSLMSGYGAASARDHGQQLGLVGLEGRQRMEAIKATNQGRLDAYDKELETKKALAGLTSGATLTDEEKAAFLAQERGKILGELGKAVDEQIAEEAKSYQSLVGSVGLGESPPPQPDWSRRRLELLGQAVGLRHSAQPGLGLDVTVLPYISEALNPQEAPDSAPEPEAVEDDDGYVPSRTAQTAATAYLRGDPLTVRLFERNGVTGDKIARAASAMEAEHGRRPSEAEVLAWVYDEIISKSR